MFDYNLHNKKEPAMAAAGQIAVGVVGVAALFEDAMAKLLEFPQHDGRYSEREVRQMVDTAHHLGEALKEMMDQFLMAHNREERHLEQIAGMEHRIETLKALLAAEEAKVAHLEEELEEAQGGGSAVRISIPKAG
ncbi:hypothetical protein V6R85_24265 [Agrobacterium sp. CCNWLW32]|uniref:hypothetical protein n=1 Tax=Agrobacterium sp. CCNWLW32 TaxID=3122072 RepID=UPI0030102DA8